VNAPAATTLESAPLLEPAAESRYHSLDAVRAFALLLGVVFHAAESFGPYAVHYWAIADNSPSQVLETFRHASHSFRLELFFLIAGFFAHLVWQRRGIGGFLRNRVSRILIPLIVGWLVLYPLLVFLWVTGVAKSGRWDLLGVPEQFRSAPPWQLTLGFFLNLEFLKKFDLTHLWFLYQLLVLYALALFLRWLVLASTSNLRLVTWLNRTPTYKNAATAQVGRAVHCPPRYAEDGASYPCANLLCFELDRWFRKAVSSPCKLLWFALATLPALFIQHGDSVDTPKESLIPELPATCLFAIFFGVGWALHRQPDLLRQCERHWRWHLLLGCLLAIPSRFAIPFLHKVEWLGHHQPSIRLVHCVLFSLMMWSFVFGFLGLFLRYRRTESLAWRYIADSSYWVYLVHLPLIVWLQIWVAQWPLPWVVKYPLIMLIAFPLLFLSYHYLVRSTFIGQQLNGRRMSLAAGSSAKQG
jgi:peptidoglycan/LPS O-acetylase OafA/YrhL